MSRAAAIAKPAWRIQVMRADGSVARELNFVPDSVEKLTWAKPSHGSRKAFDELEFLAGEASAEYQIRHPGKARFLPFAKRAAGDVRRKAPTLAVAATMKPIVDRPAPREQWSSVPGRPRREPAGGAKPTSRLAEIARSIVLERLDLAGFITEDGETPGPDQILSVVADETDESATLTVKIFVSSLDVEAWKEKNP